MNAFARFTIKTKVSFVYLLFHTSTARVSLPFSFLDTTNTPQTDLAPLLSASRLFGLAVPEVCTPLQLTLRQFCIVAIENGTQEFCGGRSLANSGDVKAVGSTAFVCSRRNGVFRVGLDRLPPTVRIQCQYSSRASHYGGIQTGKQKILFENDGCIARSQEQQQC